MQFCTHGTVQAFHLKFSSCICSCTMVSEMKYRFAAVIRALPPASFPFPEESASVEEFCSEFPCQVLPERLPQTAMVV